MYKFVSEYHCYVYIDVDNDYIVYIIVQFVFLNVHTNFSNGNNHIHMYFSTFTLTNHIHTSNSVVLTYFLLVASPSFVVRLSCHALLYFPLTETTHSPLEWEPSLWVENTTRLDKTTENTRTLERQLCWGWWSHRALYMCLTRANTCASSCVSCLSRHSCCHLYLPYGTKPQK